MRMLVPPCAHAMRHHPCRHRPASLPHRRERRPRPYCIRVRRARRQARNAGSEYTRKLVEEQRAYYAPCECEAECAWSLLRPQDRLERLHQERHRRWKKENGGSLYMSVKKPLESPMDCES